MTLSLTTHSTKSNNNSLACQQASGASLAAGATLKCTSTVCDSGNLEIRLEGVLFISEQSFKELSVCAQSASDSGLGQEGARSALPTLRSALNPVFCRVFMPAQSQTFSHRHSGTGQGEGEERRGG